MIEFIAQFISSTTVLLIAYVLFWKSIKKIIRSEVELKCLEKKIAKLDEPRDGLKLGDVVAGGSMRPFDEYLGIYIGKNKFGTNVCLDKFGGVNPQASFVTKSKKKYNIKINFEEIPTEEEKLKKRVEDLESINKPKYDNNKPETNKNETTNKI
jgi:hypothetical protein